MSRLQDINDQLKRRANEARLTIEAFEIIDKLGGLEAGEQDLTRRIAIKNSELDAVGKQLEEVQGRLEASNRLLVDAQNKSQEIISSAQSAAQQIIEAANEEVSGVRAEILRLRNNETNEIGERRSTLLSLERELQTKQNEMDELREKINEVKADARNRFGI